MDGKILILIPLSLFPGTHRDQDLTTPVFSQQLVPLVYVEIGKGTIGMQTTPFLTLHLHVNIRERIICH